jgi:hypothetical protein
VMAAFCGIATNVTLAVHIDNCNAHRSSNDGSADQEHDSSKCSTCMALQNHAGKFIIITGHNHIGTVEFNSNFSFQKNISSSNPQRKPFAPRGPPSLPQR